MTDELTHAETLYKKALIEEFIQIADTYGETVEKEGFKIFQWGKDEDWPKRYNFSGMTNDGRGVSPLGDPKTQGWKVHLTWLDNYPIIDLLELKKYLDENVLKKAMAHVEYRKRVQRIKEALNASGNVEPGDVEWVMKRILNNEKPTS